MRRSAVALLLGASLVLLAGCGSSGTASTTTTSAATTTSSSTSTTAAGGSTTSTAASGTPAFYEVHTGTVAGLGTVLVNGPGNTLYLFEPDKQSGSSTCYGACAQGWPPLLLPSGVTTPVAGAGVKSSLLGTTHRTDGTVQVTYNKWPVYLWVGNAAGPGHGASPQQPRWPLVRPLPDGKAITTKP